MVWLRGALSARGKPARLAYDDKLAGDVLVLALDSGDRDELVEITAARRQRGRAHLTVMASTRAGAASAHEAMSRLHPEVSRLATAKRKFSHRIDRLIERLAAEWSERATVPSVEALEQLRAGFPEAVSMTGVGFHVDLAGAGDHHTRDVYPSAYGAAVMLDGRWRGLAWDPEARRWRVRAGTMSAIRRSRGGVDVEGAGVSLAEAAVVGAAAAAAALAAADINQEVERSKKNEGSCEWGDMFDPCDILDCSLSLGDIGNCVPDCGSFDCGGLDCSF
jgi:hypothetical protein